MNTDRMTVHELAKALGKSPMWVVDELRRDSKRDVKQWPFATSKQSETGRWSYVIIRTQFQKWKNGDGQSIDYQRLADIIVDRNLADMIADRLAEQLSQKAHNGQLKVYSA